MSVGTGVFLIVANRGGRTMKCAFATSVLVLGGFFVGLLRVGVPEVGGADVGLEDCVVLFFPFCRYQSRAWHTGP